MFTLTATVSVHRLLLSKRVRANDFLLHNNDWKQNRCEVKMTRKLWNITATWMHDGIAEQFLTMISRYYCDNVTSNVSYKQL